MNKLVKIETKPKGCLENVDIKSDNAIANSGSTDPATSAPKHPKIIKTISGEFILRSVSNPEGSRLTKSSAFACSSACKISSSETFAFPILIFP